MLPAASLEENCAKQLGLIDWLGRRGSFMWVFDWLERFNLANGKKHPGFAFVPQLPRDGFPPSRSSWCFKPSALARLAALGLGHGVLEPFHVSCHIESGLQYPPDHCA
jgi:hypothetical protein